MKTREQLVEETEDWVARNPNAYRAIVDAAKTLSDAGEDTPFKFLIEVLRYNRVFGHSLMWRVVTALSNVNLAKGEYAIPNEITSGIARKVAKELEGYPNFHANLKRSRFDEPEEPPAPRGDGEQLALF